MASTSTRPPSHVILAGVETLRRARQFAPSRTLLLASPRMEEAALRMGLDLNADEPDLVVLLRDNADRPLLLQVKEASASVLAPYVGTGEPVDNGHRVVVVEVATRAAPLRPHGSFASPSALSPSGRSIANTRCARASRPRAHTRGRSSPSRRRTRPRPAQKPDQPPALRGLPGT